MHSLVHLATRIWVQRRDMTTTIEIAIRYLAAIFPNSDYANRDLWREYLPHVFRVLKCGEELDIEEKFDLYFWIGRYLKIDGRISEAVRHLQRACQWRNRHFAEDHPYRLTSQHELASAYNANGQTREAVTLLEQVVAIRIKTLVKDHSHRLASQHELARAYNANSQIREAVALFEQVVATQAKTLAEDHPRRLASQQWLAYILGNRDEFV